MKYLMGHSETSFLIFIQQFDYLVWVPIRFEDTTTTHLSKVLLIASNFMFCHTSVWNWCLTMVLLFQQGQFTCENSFPRCSFWMISEWSVFSSFYLVDFWDGRPEQSLWIYISSVMTWLSKCRYFWYITISNLFMKSSSRITSSRATVLVTNQNFSIDDGFLS